jgi:hypothetical protein
MFMNTQQVKDQLRAIGPLKPFSVVFQKVDGTLRTMFCKMDVFDGDPESEFRNNVPVIEESSGRFRSFNVDTVLEINH